MSYYNNFGWVLRSSWFRRYIRWVYRKGVEDLKRLDRAPHFDRQGFTCLLCGVGNENTAFEFITFIRERNAKALVWIIDLGAEQIQGVKRMVSERFPNDDAINVFQINALELPNIIEKESLDWIETDGFLPYFDSDSLRELIDVWGNLLRPDGFITTRSFSTRSFFGRLTDRFMVWVSKHWLGVTVYGHSRDELAGVFNEFGFTFVEGMTPLPTFKRFTLVKL